MTVSRHQITPPLNRNEAERNRSQEQMQNMYSIILILLKHKMCTSVQPEKIQKDLHL